jgi:hypothetical protein
MMDIIVPSLGRANGCATMKWLEKANRPIVFAVHRDEAEAYAKGYPQAKIMILSDGCRKHTGLVRQEIMQTRRSPFFFVDDDIRMSLKLVASVASVFDSLELHMKAGASMAGIAPQLYSSFANLELVNHDAFAVRNKFVATVYGIDPTHFDDCPLDKLPVYEDIALVIHAIERGGGTVVSYIATHSNVSPSGGGCNAWRDKKITIESLETLVSLYPHVCSIKETNNTTHSQQIGIGLRVAWSKIKPL